VHTDGGMDGGMGGGLVVGWRRDGAIVDRSDRCMHAYIGPRGLLYPREWSGSPCGRHGVPRRRENRGGRKGADARYGPVAMRAVAKRAVAMRAGRGDW